MAKSATLGTLHEPLTGILGTRGKVAVLRVLWRADVAIPYREVVRRAEMAYRSIDLALGELTQAGLVEELEGGRERRVRLASAHRLAPAVAALMQVEADFFGALRAELRNIAEGCRRYGLESAAIVGPAARGGERLGAPLEIVALVADPAGVARCRAAFDAAADGLRPRFGVQLKVALYDLPAARTMWRTRTAAAERTVRESEPLVGPALLELLGEVR